MSRYDAIWLRTRLLALLCALLLGPASAASAGVGPANPDDASKDPEVLELRELYDKAHVAFLAGRHLDAAAAFDAGYAQSGGMVAFLYNAAVAWERAGNLEQAIERYAEYMTKAPDAEDYAEVAERVEKLKVAVEQHADAQVMAIAETKGVIVLSSTPAGAEVRLDNPEGPVWAVTPYQGTLPPGEHIVYVSAPGYKRARRQFPDNAGKVLIGHFGLSEEYFLGQLEIKSAVPGAEVYLMQLTDAEGAKVPESAEARVTAVGRTPFSNQIAPGTWEIRVTKEGYVEYTTIAEVAQGKIRTVEAKLELEATGRVRFEAATPPSVGARALLGDSLVCELPCAHDFPPGHYELTIEKDKMKALKFELDVHQADRITIDVTLEPRTKRAPAIVTGSLMAVTAGIGTWFALQAKATEESLESDLDARVQFDTEDPRRRQGFTQAVVADAAFGATAVLGILTIYYALRQTGELSRGERRTESLSRLPELSPVIGRGAVGVTGRVRF